MVAQAIRRSAIRRSVVEATDPIQFGTAVFQNLAGYFGYRDHEQRIRSTNGHGIEDHPVFFLIIPLYRTMVHYAISIHQPLQRAHIALLVAGLVDRSFGDEGAVVETRIVEQPAERIESHGSLPDVLVAIELGTARGFGIVAVPDTDSFEGDGRSNLLHRFGVAFGGDQVVAGNVGVAGVEADGDGRMVLEARDKFGDLLEAAAQRELRAGCVLNQDMEASSLPRQAVDGALDGVGCKLEAFVARQPLPGAGMQDKIFGAEDQRALDFAAKRRDALLADLGGLAADVHQVAGVDDQRADVEFGAQVPACARPVWGRLWARATCAGWRKRSGRCWRRCRGRARRRWKHRPPSPDARRCAWPCEQFTGRFVPP